jgi:hypothetical protein
VSSGLNSVVSFFSGLPGRIVGALGNLAGALVGAGRSLIDGLLAGIKAGVQAVLSFASGIASQIAAVKGPRAYDLRVLIPAGQALMDGLLTGIQKGTKPVLDYVHDIAKQIVSGASVDSHVNLGFSAPGAVFGGIEKLLSGLFGGHHGGRHHGGGQPGGGTTTPTGPAAPQITNNIYALPTQSPTQIAAETNRRQQFSLRTAQSSLVAGAV